MCIWFINAPAAGGRAVATNFKQFEWDFDLYWNRQL